MGKYTATVHDRLILPARVLLSPGQEHRMRLAGRIVPAPVSVRLLIDTGSGRSTLIPSLIAHLNPMSQQGAVRVSTSVGSAETHLFWVRLEFPDTGLAPVTEVAVARLALPPSLQAFHGIIGRDLLRRWAYLLYQGRRGRFIIRDTPGGLVGWLLRLGII
jgi:hypothetical protein